MVKSISINFRCCKNPTIMALFVSERTIGKAESILISWIMVSKIHL
jgi:hypothetical protein